MGEPVLLAEAAERRGFTAERYKHPMLAFRRWCRRVGVPIREVGGLEWVVPSEIDAAIICPRTPPANEAPPPDVQSIVAAVKGAR